MKRPEQYVPVSWDHPIWQVSRMLVDLVKAKLPTAAEIPRFLAASNAPAAAELAAHLNRHPDVLGPVADHLALRADLAADVEAQLRTEEQAIAALTALGEAEVSRYGTRSADHHQSSKVVVQTVAALTHLTAAELGVDVNVNPQGRVVLVRGDGLWVSPRRLDGALPGLMNPVGVWEIKEYWGKTKGGSKMSDAIYEIHLVGAEIREFERRHGPCLAHYAIIDGKEQWSHRRSDLRRAVDLLCMGLIDELIAGEELVSDWPRITRTLCKAAGRLP